MALIVQKFGGTSVATIERIKHVATIVKRDVDAGHQVIVVVSAMAGVTNQLVDYCAECQRPDEQRAAARMRTMWWRRANRSPPDLLALELQSIGLRKRAHGPGWQIPLNSDGAYSKARIGEIGTSCDQRIAEKRRSCGHRRLSGRKPRRAHQHAWAWRFGYVGGGDRCRIQRRALRYLYGCGWGLYHATRAS